MSNLYANATAAELLSALKNAGRAPSLDLIRTAMNRRQDLTPGLLDMLATTPDENWTDDDPRWYAQIHAGHLLIFFREPGAVPVFMQLLRAPDNDMAVEWFGVALASYGLGIFPSLSELLNDPEAPEYARTVMTEALEQAAVEFPTERTRVIEILRNSLPPLDKNGALGIPKPRPEKPNIVWAFIASALANLSDFQSRPQIEALYRANWMDEVVMGDQQGYLDRLLNPKPLRSNAFNLLETYRQLQEEQAAGTAPATDPGSEWDRESITALQAQLRELNAQAAETAPDPEPPPAAPPPPRTAKPSIFGEPSPVMQPARRAGPKVGRNDPCPCGSGRKYKHCHGKS